MDYKSVGFEQLIFINHAPEKDALYETQNYTNMLLLNTSFEFFNFPWWY